MTEIEEEELFGQSCVKVVKCFLQYQVNEEARRVAEERTIEQGNLDDMTYNYTTRDLCETIVTETYETMSTWIMSLETIKNINYGDDLLLNGKHDDGPFDLLADIETIGDVLFAHNDDPSEVHFFSMQPPESYVDNDPNETTPYQTELPNWDEGWYHSSSSS